MKNKIQSWSKPLIRVLGQSSLNFHGFVTPVDLNRVGYDWVAYSGELLAFGEVERAGN